MYESLKTKTLSSLLWKFLERGGSAVVGIVVQIAMARLLAPEQFGALAIMLVFVNVGGVIVQSGLNTALVQSARFDKDDCSTVFWMSFSISVALFSVIFAFAPSIANFYEMDYLKWPLRILAFVLIINSFNAVQIAIVQRALEFRKILKATLASVVVSGVVGVLAAACGAGLWALVAQQLIYQVCNCVVLACQVRWFPRLSFNIPRAKELFSFGWKLLVSGLLDQGYQSLSDLIIGKQFSASSLGLVSQGKKYPQAIGSMLDGAIQPVMLSVVSRVQEDAAYVKRLVRRALKTSTFLILPSMAFLAVIAEPAVRLLLGEQWLSCVPFVQMYCFVYALLPIHTTNLQALNGIGRSDLFLKLEVVKKACGVAIILFTAFVLNDLYAMVIGYMLNGVIATFINSLPSKRALGYAYSEQLRDMAPAVFLSIASSGAACLLRLIPMSSLYLIAAQAIVMFSVYLLLARLFRVEEFSYLVKTTKEVLASKGVCKQ